MLSKIKLGFDRPFQSPVFWLMFIVFRMLASITMTRWNHPDEWYQTAELSNLLWNKRAMYTGEIGLHMRNLTWPVLLGIPIHLADLIDHQSAFLRPFFIRFFTGFLDIGILWGWIQCTKNLDVADTVRTNIFRLLSFSYLGLWFLIQDSVRPSQEHMASVLFWVSIGFFAKHLKSGLNRDVFLAAFFSVGIAAMKYPAALFTLGLFLSAIVFSLPITANRVRLRMYLLGLIIGLFSFGLSDWVVYGRPFESFYTYFVFNVITGLSSKYFGSQSGFEYFRFFQGHWLTVLIPVSVLVIIAILETVYRSLYRRAGPKNKGRNKVRPFTAIAMTIGFSATVYISGHLLISHKEGRFIWPIESILIWFFVISIGTSMVFRNWKQSVNQLFNRRLVSAVLTMILFGPNLGFVVKSLWGDSFRTNSTYFEIDRLLKTYPETCAVITARKPLAVHLPKKSENTSNLFAFGFFPAEREGGNFALASNRPLYWMEDVPKCADQGIVLLHLPKYEANFLEKGCTLLPSAILKWVPQSRWPDFLSKEGFVSGIWMKCAPNIIEIFAHQETAHPFATTFGHFESLPRPTITGEELLRLGKAQVVNPSYGYLPDDGTFGKW